MKHKIRKHKSGTQLRHMLSQPELDRLYSLRRSLNRKHHVILKSDNNNQGDQKMLKKQPETVVPVPPKPVPPTFKILAVNVGDEFTPEEGWSVKDLISTPIGKDNEPSTMIFHVVLMKLPPAPEQARKSGIVTT